MKYSTMFLMLFFLINSALPQTTEMSLEDAIGYAFQNNLNIKNSQINVADADQQIIETRALGIPKISLGAKYNYFIDIPTQIMPDFFSPAVYGILFQEGLVEPQPINTTGTFEAQFGRKHNFTASADMSTLLFDGSYIVGLRTSKLYRRFAEQQLTATQNDIKNKVIDAYLPSLLLSENLMILQKNISNLEKLLFETKQLYKEGFVEQLDVDRLDLSLSNLKIEKENLERQKTIVLNYLKMAIGFPIKEKLTISDDINSLLTEVTEVEMTSDIIFKRRPEYTLATTNIELQNMNIDRYRTAYLPRLIGFGSYQQALQANNKDDASWNPTSIIGAQLSINIFDGWGRKAKIQRAKLAKEIATNRKTELEKAITLEVTNARTSYFNAKNKLDNRKKNLELAEKIFNTTKIKYNEGIGSSLELSQAEQSLYLSQSNYTMSLYELLVAKKKLEKALGN